MPIIKHNGRYIRSQAGPIGPKNTTTATLPEYSFGSLISQRVVDASNTYIKHIVTFTISVIGTNATSIIIQYSADNNANIPFGETVVPNVVGSYTVEIPAGYLRQSYPLYVRIRAVGAGLPCRSDITTILEEGAGVTPEEEPDITVNGDYDLTTFAGTSTLVGQPAEYPIPTGTNEWFWETYDEDHILIDTGTNPTYVVPNPPPGEIYTVRVRNTAYDENDVLLNTRYSPTYNVETILAFPADINTYDWTVSTITDPDESNGVAGLQKLTIINPITIPTGFRLYWYSNTVNSVSAWNPGLPQLNEVDTVYKTITPLAVGTTVYPRLFWERISDNAFEEASVRPSYPILAINSAAPPTKPTYIRSSTGAGSTTPSVAHDVNDLLIVHVFTSTTGAGTINVPNNTWTKVGSTSTGNGITSAIIWKVATSTTELTDITWAYTAKVYVYQGYDPADPIGAAAQTTGASGATTNDPGLTLEGNNSLVDTFKFNVTASPALSGARSGITLTNSANRIVSGYSTTVPVVSWAAQNSIANANGTTGGYHSDALEIKGEFVVDPGGSWPADIASGDWTSYSVTNNSEAGDVEGLRASTIAASVSIPVGYRLFTYMGTSNTPTPSLTTTPEFTSSVRRKVSTNTLAVGTTIYPKLYWYRTSDGGWHQAASKSSYTVQALAGGGSGDDILVTSLANLRSNLISAPAGRILEVQSGTVTSMDLSNINKSGVVTIRPQNRANPPIIRALTVTGSNRIKFDGMSIIGVRPGSGWPADPDLFRINLQNSSNLEFVDCDIYGGPVLMKGNGSDNTVIQYCTLRGCSKDAIQFYQSIRGLTIQHVAIVDWEVELSGQNSDNAHPDAIQMNCNANDAYSADITITDNVIDSRQIGSHMHGYLNGKFALWGITTRPLDTGSNPCGTKRAKFNRNFVRGNHRDGCGWEGMVDSEIIGNLMRRLTRAEASNPDSAADIDTREIGSPMITLGRGRNGGRTDEPYLSFRNITVDNNVVSDATTGNQDATANWNVARDEPGWGINVNVTRHVASNTAVPVGWVYPTAGQYSRGNGP